MNLKPLVNNVELYSSFLEEIESRIKVAQSILEQVTTQDRMFVAQGEIKALRRLLLLREQVNQGDPSG
jgi:hypothetical protein